MILTLVLEQIENETDQEFMTSLYHANIHIMLRIVRGVIADESVCEDVIQETLINLISKIPKLRGMDKESITAYTVASVKNTALTFLRKRSVEQKYILWSDFSDGAIGEYLRERQTEDDIVTVEQAAELYGLLRELPEREQELLYRKYFLEQSDVEIAKHLGCAPNSVRMLLTRARRMLLKQIQNGGREHEIR